MPSDVLNGRLRLCIKLLVNFQFDFQIFFGVEVEFKMIDFVFGGTDIPFEEWW